LKEKTKQFPQHTSTPNIGTSNAQTKARSIRYFTTNLGQPYTHLKEECESQLARKLSEIPQPAQAPTYQLKTKKSQASNSYL
jgi:hypothetical protein